MKFTQAEIKRKKKKQKKHHRMLELNFLIVQFSYSSVFHGSEKRNTPQLNENQTDANKDIFSTALKMSDAAEKTQVVQLART